MYECTDLIGLFGNPSTEWPKEFMVDGEYVSQEELLLRTTGPMGNYPDSN
jgi:hypothetical protein